MHAHAHTHTSGGQAIFITEKHRPKMVPQLLGPVDVSAPSKEIKSIDNTGLEETRSHYKMKECAISLGYHKFVLVLSDLISPPPQQRWLCIKNRQADIGCGRRNEGHLVA